MSLGYLTLSSTKWRKKPGLSSAKVKGMAITTRRASQPMLSGSGEQILAQYEHHLRVEEDLASATISLFS
jgi:hypothetical protein